ncbi:unnamed protein product [Adineta ricciae]|uniref:Uncharacterized protein n=1 Tax=Adineta ricciae TaxID=249248 RepID=A0A815ID41_ADIRI|nr:unnamed protein product [Adineta ricciae]CAF1366500.1 unnamed protein product [Adineta ricciae]
MNDNIEQDLSNTNSTNGYVRLSTDDNQINRNYVILTYKQILTVVSCVLTIIILLLVTIVIIFVKTNNQTIYTTYNTTSGTTITTTETSTIELTTSTKTTTKILSKIETSTTQSVLSSSCPIPITNAEWNQKSIIFVNPLARCLLNENGLCRPQDLFIDNMHDNLYVVDTQNNRIQKYSLTEPYDPQQGAVGLTVASKNLIEPQSIFVDNETEDMYILDHITKITQRSFDSGYRVHLWKKNDQTGRILFSEVVGEYGFGKNQASYLTLDKEMNIYVGTKFYIKKWLFSSNYTKKMHVAGKTGAEASGPSDLWDPYAFYVDDDLTLYIADWQNKRIQKWLFNATEGITLASNLLYVYGLTMGCNGYLYYTDVYDHSIFQLNLKNNEKTRVIGDGSQRPLKKMLFATVMKFDKFGNIFVIDSDSGYRIRKFSIIQK